MQARRGDETEEVAGADSVVITAGEEPGLATDCDDAQFALRAIVVEQKATVVEETTERSLLAKEVAERLAQRAALVAHLLPFVGGPYEEGFDVRSQVGIAQPLDFVMRPARPRGIELEDAANAGETLSTDDTLRDGRFPEATSRVRVMPRSA